MEEDKKELQEKVDELFKALYDITAAESPKDMYYIAVDTLAKYDKEPAPHN